MFKKIVNRFAKLTMVPCGFCTREIIKEQETNSELFMKDGKPMCRICRAVKLSPFRAEIESTKEKMREDLKEMNDKFDKEEFDRMIHVAAEAQAVVEKKIKA